MNVLIIQEKGRHKKNEEFREALNMKRSLNRIENVNATVWGLNYNNFDISFDEMQKDKDAILLLENYEINGWLPDLSKSNKLKLFWSIDSHMALNNHVVTAKKNKIDIVLNAIESHSFAFKKHHKTYYFPNCYPSDLIYPIFDENRNKYDIGFVGGDGSGDRRKLIDHLVKKYDMKRPSFFIGEDMVKEVNSYKIHFNKNISEDVNYRTFETLGMQTFLLTDLSENLDNLLEVGKEVETYSSIDELEEKIDHYLKHDKERETIAKNGYNKVIEEHTYDKRAKDLLNIIEENI